jgi:hypothetical protein
MVTGGGASGDGQTTALIGTMLDSMMQNAPQQPARQNSQR